MAIGLGRAALEELRGILEEAGVEISSTPGLQPARGGRRVPRALEADWEASYLLALRAAWMADNKKPNSLEASMSKAKAGRTGTAVSLKAVELAGSYGYSQRPLLEKWARDSKISTSRGHPADPAAHHRPEPAGQEFGRAEVATPRAISDHSPVPVESNSAGTVSSDSASDEEPVPHWSRMSAASTAERVRSPSPGHRCV